MASPTMPLLGRSRSLLKSNNRTSNGLVTANGKSRGKSNGSILNFFKKAAPAAKSNGNGLGNCDDTDSLFLGENSVQQGAFSRPRSPTPDDLYDDTFEPSQDSPKTTGAVSCDAEVSRFHENETSIKRRRLGSVSPVGGSGNITNGVGLPEMNDGILGQSPGEDGVVMLKEGRCSPPPPDFQDPVIDHPKRTLTPAIEQHTGPDIPNSSTTTPSEAVARSAKRRIGPFIEDSDSDDDMAKVIMDRHELGGLDLDADKSTKVVALGQQQAERDPTDDKASTPTTIPLLKQESTSVFGDDGFDGIEDFGDDEFPDEGEEYIERRWMEEQRRIEMGLEDEEYDELAEGLIKEVVTDNKPRAQAEDASSCPICSVSFAGITDSVSLHMHVQGPDTVLYYTGSFGPCQSLSGWKSYSSSGSQACCQA